MVPTQVKDKDYFLLHNKILTERSILKLGVTAFEPGERGGGKIFKDSTLLYANGKYNRKLNKSEVFLQIDNDHEIIKSGMDVNYCILIMKNRQLLQSAFLVS